MRRLFELARSAYHVLPAGVRGWGPLQFFSKRVTANVGTHDDLYNEQYYARIDADTVRVAPVLAGLLKERFGVGTVVDVGCGTGAVLRELVAQGWGGVGLEYAEAAIKVCRERGLTVHKFDLESTAPLPIDGKSGVVVSMEVAEHLPESCADKYVETLTRLSDRVVLTAATPGQQGLDHVNEQPHSYWIAKLAGRGFDFHEAESARWRSVLKDAGVSLCYHANVMIFERSTATAPEARD